MLNKENKIAIITGGSKGIGKSIIELFEKNDITCYDFSRTNGIDVTNEIAVNIKVNSIISSHGKIDILVNNAGIISTTDILDMDVEEWRNIIDVNLTGAFICTKAVIKNMKENKYGKIINISSIAGTDRSKVASIAYTASKHGLIGLTRQLSLYYAKYNININSVAPSQTLTDMLKDNLTERKIELIMDEVPAKRLLEPEEVAKTVLFLSSDESSYINGETININGGQ